MRKKLFIFAVAWIATMAASAQPMAMQQPGRQKALPELHINKTTTGNAQRRVAVAGGKTQVVLAGSTAPRRSLRTIADADASLFDGRTLYGAMVNSNLWANMSITQVPYGIYSFTMGSTEAPTAHFTDMSYNFMSGAWGRDRHYGIVPLSIIGAINGARYITINTRDWQETRNVMWGTEYGTYSLIASVMAYDPTSDDFYAFQYKEDLTGLNWVRLNQETDRMEQVAQYRGTTAVLTLAATPDGQMYCIDTAGDLYTVNKENGRTSLVANTGVSPTNYNQCMVYDGKTGTFLWAAQCSEGSVLFSVDPATAETKRVMHFLNNEQFVSLYTTDTEAPAAAPAAVGRPRLTTTGGDLQATIAFTMPQKTYGGDNLSGNVNLNLWIDGENVKGEPVAAGTSFSESVDFTEGNHYIAITTDNEAGFSPLRYIYQYVGYDTPKPVSGVQFDNAGGQNTITWQAPTAGVNGGYIDQTALTYDVVRMPDSVTVATGLTATTFAEATPQAMHLYSYRIIGDNHGHKAAYAESNAVLCGSSFTVPYEQLFEDPTTLAEYFTVIDNDGDGNTWRQGYTTEVRMDFFKNSDADDWLISPPISMEAGMKYRFTMNMKTFTPQYPEDFEVLIGTDPQNLTTFRLLKREEGFTEIASEFGDYTTDFLITESRDYHMAVRYCSKKDSNSSLMMIHNFAVTTVGNSAAPAQPADFTVTPDADDQLKATITLTAPQKNLQDESIAQLTAVSLYRDDATEPLHTWTEPVPGQSLSFTDEQVPSVGLHTYTAVATSAEGRGEPVSQERFIGVYTAPYAEDFEDRKYGELWTTEDNITDNNNGWYGWRWTENYNTYGRFLSMYYYLMTDTPTDIWLFSPKLRLEADAVYTVSYDGNMQYSYYPDMSYGLYQGTAPTASAMTTLVADLPSTDYALDRREHLLVNTEAGRYYLGFKAHGATAYDYFNANIDNFSLTYRTSARAPYQMTNFKAVADPTAALQATLTFNAPVTDYRQQPLDVDQELTISIFRGKNATIPATTLKTKPGEKVTWTDEGALHGLNYYTVACDNAYGRGELIADTIFVGLDVPAVVGSYAVRGSADNKDAVITWAAPAAGANGGVVLKGELTYNVYAYDIDKDELKPLAQGVTGNTYTVECSELPNQQMFYYAVSAQNSEGEGQASAASVVLGKPYNLPFKESFAGATLSTQLWQAVPMVQGATSCGLDNPSASYNQCASAQDEDGGCAYFYNGYQYEIQAGALLVSPKVKLAPVAGNELHFWTYNFQEVYSTPATVQVAISSNDSQFSFIANATYTVGTATEEGWTEHVVSLDRYRNANFVSIALLGITSGYQDVIYVDNISIVNDNADGINTVSSDQTSLGKPSYDLHGRRVNPAVYRGIIVTDGKKKVRIR